MDKLIFLIVTFFFMTLAATQADDLPLDPKLHNSNICAILHDPEAINTSLAGQADLHPSLEEQYFLQELPTIEADYFKITDSLNKPDQIEAARKSMWQFYESKLQTTKWYQKINYFFIYILNLFNVKKASAIPAIQENKEVTSIFVSAVKELQNYDQQLLPFLNSPDSLYCSKDFGVCAGYAQLTRLFYLLIQDGLSDETSENVSKTNAKNLSMKDQLRLESLQIRNALLSYKPYRLQYFATKKAFIQRVLDSPDQIDNNILIDTALVLWFRNFLSFKGLKQLIDYNVYGIFNLQMSSAQISQLFSKLKELTSYYAPLLYVTMWDHDKHGKDIHVVLGFDVHLFSHDLFTHQPSLALDYITIRDDKFYGAQTVKTFENRIYFTPAKSDGTRNIFYIAPHVFQSPELFSQLASVMMKTYENSPDQVLSKLHQVLQQFLQTHKNSSDKNVQDMIQFLGDKLDHPDRGVFQEFIDAVDRIDVVPGEQKVIYSVAKNLQKIIKK